MNVYIFDFAFIGLYCVIAQFSRVSLYEFLGILPVCM